MRHLRLLAPAAVLWAAGVVGSASTPVAPLPDVVAPKLPDVLAPLDPSRVHVDGWLGHRLDVNLTRRLAVVDTAPLLAGYQHKPGIHPWIGEHVGKWLHAATLAWAYSGDPALRAKLDAVVADLIAAQEPDGYLGTYAPEKRFGLYEGADWDVWSHKYNLIGLLTYHRYTGSAPALAAARRAADLLLATFPAKRSINAAGTHRGMAATSTLEPMVLLHRATGDERYLAFARYLVAASAEPGGAGIPEALNARRGVNRIANAKAYEMLSNLVGLCELARTTGDRVLLTNLQAAWKDIAEQRLYLTGTASSHEHFVSEHELPDDNDASVGETCVTVTWLQFNLQLLRLTGDAAFAEQIERTLYNHLTAAQHPDGADWCYFTPLTGVKKYDQDITCCHSSGPRGLALAPTTAFLQSERAMIINTLESSRATFVFGGQALTVEIASRFPRGGGATLRFHAAQPVRAALRLRVPAWAAPLRLGAHRYGPGWAEIPVRDWKEGDQLEVDYALGGAAVPGDYTNFARTALTWGPFVLAADRTRNASLDVLAALRLEPKAAPELADGGPALAFVARVRGPWDEQPRDLHLVPFADAGAHGESYRVWWLRPQ